jgi:small subunit ribosomal protein S18
MEDNKNIENDKFSPDMMERQDEMMDKDDKDGRGGKGRTFFRKKVCRFCKQAQKMDYKDMNMLRRYTTERGKILPRRITGTCSKHQRELAVTIKRARAIAFLPYVSK